MKNISLFLATAAGVFAALPGVAVLISNVGVPPNSSTALFSATIEALGVLTLMLLWLNRKNIQKRTEKNVTNLAIGGIVIFLISLFGYMFLYGYLVADVPNSNPLFFPLCPQGELKSDLAKLGDRYTLIKEFGRDDVAKLIQSSSATALLITTLLLLFIYQLVFVSLAFSFGILAIKTNSNEEGNKQSSANA
jgi:lysylphosphatidylglycerol synthetase-like protein (DUF2156 family)